LKGTYTLLLVCKGRFRVMIGRLGYANVDAGYYLYTGSALGVGAQSLEGRLQRHSQRSKKRRWHVDYLTSNPRCRIRTAVWLISPRRVECAINQAVGREFNAKPVLPRAGSSDCKCNGHLMKIQSPIGPRRISALLVSVYRRFGRPVRCIRFANSLHKLSVWKA
jgi:Uri superfamily endonuclease